MRSLRRRVALPFAVLALALSSCGGGGPTLYPASGTVRFNGQPAAGATVVFIPLADGSGPKPSGLVGDDGRFELTTHPHGKGAPAGEYAVVVTKFPDDARSQAHPKNQLPARYADPATSGLKRTVAAGATVVEPIELTGEPARPGKGQ